MLEARLLDGERASNRVRVYECVSECRVCYCAEPRKENPTVGTVPSSQHSHLKDVLYIL